MRFLEGSVGSDWSEILRADYRYREERKEKDIDDYVRTRVSSICDEIFLPNLYATLTRVSSMLEKGELGYGYDLDKKDQLAHSLHPALPEGEFMNLFTGKTSTGRIERTTRLQHGWVTTMFILEFMVESMKYGSEYSKAEWTSAALLGLLHDALHPNCSHSGEIAIRELAKIANGESIFWLEWIKSFNLELSMENLKVFGKSPADRRKYWSHERMLEYELNDERSSIGSILEGAGVRGETIELLKEQIAGRGLGEILDYCDTFAYLDMDHLGIKGYPFVFSNGQGILQGLLSSIYYKKGFGWQFVSESQGESIVKEALALRARTMRETTRSMRNSINQAMQQRMIVMEFLLGRINLWDIYSGGDLVLFDKLSKSAKDFIESDSLGPVLEFFDQTAISGTSDFAARGTIMPQNEFGYVLRNFSMKYDRNGLLATVSAASGRELEVVDVLELAVFEGVKKYDPSRISLASRGAFTLIPPYRANDKYMRVGDTLYRADELAVPEMRDFCLAIANPIDTKGRNIMHTEEWDKMYKAIRESVFGLPEILGRY